jgi:type I restriction enzyme S subunit
MRNLSQRKIRSAPIALAPIAEQEVIIRRVKASRDTVDVLEAMLNQERPRLEHLQQALLAKAFRGELVPQDPTDEPASALLQRIRAERNKPADSEPSPRTKRRRETKVA